MRPDAVLGFDPAPGDPSSVDRLSEILHKVIRGLVETRLVLDALGPAGSVWDGAVGAPVVALLRRYSLRLRELEDALLGCLTTLDGWKTGVEERQSRVRDIVNVIADLAGESAEERRDQQLARAREVDVEHQRAARGVAAAFEELSATVERLGRSDNDLADEVDAAVRAMAQAVEDWVESEGPELVRTAVALGEVAALTTVISELVGVAALDRTPGDDAGVREIISRSPGAHRLIKALQQQWLEVAPDLPEASFGRDRPSELAESIAGRLAGGEADQPGDETDQ
jgi:hypothetical protein